MSKDIYPHFNSLRPQEKSSNNGEMPLHCNTERLLTRFLRTYCYIFTLAAGLIFITQPAVQAATYAHHHHQGHRNQAKHAPQKQPAKQASLINPEDPGEQDILIPDYLEQVLGTPIPTHQTAAELMATKPFLAPPLPEETEPSTEQVPSSSRNLVSNRLFSSRSLLWPMRGGLVSSRFGMRWGRLHQGTDIAAPYGTSILAAAAGTVAFSGVKGGYGQLIIVDHGNGIETKYGHCSKRLVALGETVHQGEIIGKVGMTGHTTGPHLHYEVIHAGEAKNPEFFTRRR